MQTLIIALGLSLAAAMPVPRANGPWDGTWRLDRSRSHLTGQTTTLSKTTAGKWRYSDGTISYDFALDGKPVKTFADETMSATGDGDHVLNLVFKSTGTESQMHLVLSADGKTISVRSTGTRPDGTKTEDTGAMERVGGGSGFAGTWKSTKSESNSESSFALVITGDRIKWSWPAFKRQLEGKMDGSETHVTGQAATPWMVFMIRKVSATKITYMVKGDGKNLAQGVLELSADGKTLTDTEWAPAKPAEKAIGVYSKE